MAIDQGGPDAGPLASTDYHRVSARVLEIANKLRALGVDSVLQVPTLVIAGDQSSGKSSVVEAIAGVPLPRSDGTCTRCPTEVRMRTQAATADLEGDMESPGGGEDGSGMEEDGEGAANGADGKRRPAWRCRIKLCRDYDSEDKPLAEKPPEQPFCVVRDKAHIAACVSAAQAVLLNPRAVEAAAGGPQAFVPELSSAQPGRRPAESAMLRSLGDATRYELAFTSNKVVLEIDGAEADLTIIDLPGIIHDHPKGRHLVEVVERMTKTNLAPAHHIIAMALPAGLDPETQAIRLWAREVDPDGHRSIGIITKPDMIAEEAHIVCNKLVKLVGARGELGPGGTRSQPDGHLRLGYYVVKNPSQEQLVEGITFEKAREIEARYFVNHMHWRPAMATSPGLVQRLGANALRSGLSSLLVERIEEQMPAMRKSAREQLDKLRAELASLPPVCVDPNHELFQLLWRVADGLDAAAHARSDNGDHAFYQLMDRFYREYGRRVMRSTPAFLVGTTLISALNKSEKMMGAGGAGGGDDGGDLDLLSALPAVKQAPGGGAVTSSERVEAALAAGSEAVQELLSSNLLPQRPMTLAEVSRLRQRHLGRELPGFSPYSAMEELLRRFKGQWREHAEGCLQEVEAAVRELAGKTVAEQLRRYPKAERVVGRALSSHVDTLVAAAEAQLSELLGMEDSDVFTLNDHYLRDTQSTFLARLKRAYLQPQALDDNSKYQVQNLLNQLAGYGVKFTSYDAAFLAQPTPVDDELHMAASCLAYFKVAFKRIQDEVPMAIRRTLLRRLGDRQQLEAALRRELPDVAAEARGLLEEDAAVSERRRQCVDMERRLREALTVLHSPATQL